MTTTEQKRLRELAMRFGNGIGGIFSSVEDNADEIETALLAAIEPYRTALAESRRVLDDMGTRCNDGIADQHIAAIDALLGEE